MTHYAVLIGNSQFLLESKLSPLTSPLKDVEGLTAELKAEDRGLFDKVIPLANQSSVEIRKTLNRLLKESGKNDLILLYYSGHGLPNNKNNDLYLATADTEADLLESTALSFEQIYKWIGQSYCKKVVIILDCCYSGMAGQVFKSDLTSQLQSLNDKVIGTCLITAASNDQVALDQSDGGYSLFTKHLIHGLRGEADRDSSGLVTLGELFHYVREKVTADNPDQVPKRFLKDENGELILAKSGREVGKERVEQRIAYLYDLAKDRRISHEILTEALCVMAKPVKDFTAQDKARDALISECFIRKDALAFVLQWGKLSSLLIPDAPLAVDIVASVVAVASPEIPIVLASSDSGHSLSRTPFKKIAYMLVVGSVVVGLGYGVSSVSLTPQKSVKVIHTQVTQLQLLDSAMLAIPAGHFMMGCQEARDGLCQEDEKPLHEVQVGAFQMSKYEVTVGQFRAFVAATNYQTTAEKEGSCFSKKVGGRWADVKGSSWRNLGFTQTDKDPVACVSWNDAQAYLAWLNQIAGGGYRLLSEAEWEYACRAGTSASYCGGKQVGVSAWYDENSNNRTHVVGSKQANTFGLYDMSGNVWEWVQDGYHQNYAGAPSDASVWAGLEDRHVLRGGSWSGFAMDTRAANRWELSATNRLNLIGFRLARTTPARGG